MAFGSARIFPERAIASRDALGGGVNATDKLDLTRTKHFWRSTVGKTTIAEDLVITGNLSGTADIDIAGKVDGDVAGNAIDILSGGSVSGSVSAEEAHIRGNLSGSVSANTVELHSGANCKADITAQEMEMHKGAAVSGKVTISGG